VVNAARLAVAWRRTLLLGWRLPGGGPCCLSRAAGGGNSSSVPAITRCLARCWRDVGAQADESAVAVLGLSNDEIADRLVISPTTAKTHVNRTMAKLHARDRAQLVVIAYETGLITPGQRAE
jgi:DNA-binding CsgD family transcriptional regulator